MKIMNVWQQRLKTSYNIDAIGFAIASNSIHLSEDQMKIILSNAEINARIHYKKKETLPLGCELSPRQYSEMMGFCKNI